jgi:hypothetical protein
MAAHTCHMDRMKAQFRNVRELKQKLPKNEMIIQMDFAENFFISL